jgi:hypothetical protein
MPDSLRLDALYRRADSVAHRRIDDEVLLIPIRSDPRQGLAVYSLNPTAALLWELLDGAHSLADLVAALREKFDVPEETARTDVQTYCRELLDCGAIEPAGTRSP